MIYHHTIPGPVLRAAGSERWETPELAWDFAPSALVPAWEMTMPAGAAVEIELRVGDAAAWSDWRTVATWSLTEPRYSHPEHPDSWGRLETDTYRPTRPITRAQLAVTLLPALGGQRPDIAALHLVGWQQGQPAGARPLPAISVRGRERLPVPARSQMVFPNGGNVWCSPTSVQAVMDYWGRRLGRPDLTQAIATCVVPGVYDTAYDGHGNWSFNTAYVAAHGLRAYVTAWAGLEELEPYLAADVPIICSVAYSRQWLENAPIDQTAGHLLIVTGITAAGDVMVNEPAAPSDDDVVRVYQREHFLRAWLRQGVGVIYLIHPQDWKLPA